MSLLTNLQTYSLLSKISPGKFEEMKSETPKDQKIRLQNSDIGGLAGPPNSEAFIKGCGKLYDAAIAVDRRLESTDFRKALNNCYELIRLGKAGDYQNSSEYKNLADQNKIISEKITPQVATQISINLRKELGIRETRAVAPTQRAEPQSTPQPTPEKPKPEIGFFTKIKNFFSAAAETVGKIFGADSSPKRVEDQKNIDHAKLVQSSMIPDIISGKTNSQGLDNKEYRQLIDLIFNFQRNGKLTGQENESLTNLLSKATIQADGSQKPLQTPSIPTQTSPSRPPTQASPTQAPISLTLPQTPAPSARKAPPPPTIPLNSSSKTTSTQKITESSIINLGPKQLQNLRDRLFSIDDKKDTMTMSNETINIGKESLALLSKIANNNGFTQESLKQANEKIAELENKLGMPASQKENLSVASIDSDERQNFQVGCQEILDNRNKSKNRDTTIKIGEIEKFSSALNKGEEFTTEAVEHNSKLIGEIQKSLGITSKAVGSKSSEVDAKKLGNLQLRAGKIDRLIEKNPPRKGEIDLIQAKENNHEFMDKLQKGEKFPKEEIDYQSNRLTQTEKDMDIRTPGVSEKTEILKKYDNVLKQCENPENKTKLNPKDIEVVKNFFEDLENGLGFTKGEHRDLKESAASITKALGPEKQL